MQSNVFVIGMSKVGKTPIARRIAERFGFEYVSASGWVKRQFVPSDAACGDVKAYVSEITALSRELLSLNADACVEYIRANHAVANGRLVIDGIRNPRDFMLLYRPRVDLVVSVENLACSWFGLSSFERDGIAQILASLRWMDSNGVTAREAHKSAVIDGYRKADFAPDDGPTCRPPYDLDDAMVDVCEWVEKSMVHAPAVSMVNANIPRQRAWVDTRTLYDDDPSRGGWTPCVMFAVSSYAGRAPTVSIVTDSGAVFSYVQLHRLRYTSPDVPMEPALDLDALAYHNCPEGRIAVCDFNELHRAGVRAVFPRAGVTMRGEYIASVDWIDGNELSHLIALANGQFAMVPSHKMMLSDEPLPDYRKMRSEWRVREATP